MSVPGSPEFKQISFPENGLISFFGNYELDTRHKGIQIHIWADQETKLSIKIKIDLFASSSMFLGKHRFALFSFIHALFLISLTGSDFGDPSFGSPAFLSKALTDMVSFKNTVMLVSLTFMHYLLVNFNILPRFLKHAFFGYSSVTIVIVSPLCFYIAISLLQIWIIVVGFLVKYTGYFTSRFFKFLVHPKVRLATFAVLVIGSLYIDTVLIHILMVIYSFLLCASSKKVNQSNLDLELYGTEFHTIWIFI